MKPKLLTHLSLFTLLMQVVYPASWERRMFQFIDPDPNYTCYPDNRKCFNITDMPFPRQGHVAIVYKSFNSTECEKYVENCNLNSGVDSCQNCKSENQQRLIEYTLEQQRTGAWYSWKNHEKCPGECCATSDIECRRRIDNTGNPVFTDDELILIFGGSTARNKTFNNNQTKAFDSCEDYYKLTGKTDRPEALKSCGEELLNDLWRYSLRTKQWTHIKLDYNKEIQSSTQVPSPRYGHAGVYAELNDLDYYIEPDKNVYLRRKYLYIYGGFSFECTTACIDTWRYEIAYGPIAFYPRSKTSWVNAGNYWQQMHNDKATGPGPRWRHAMITYQRFIEDGNALEEHFIYMFGGIFVLSEFEKNYYSMPSGYMYKQDMWRFNLLSNQWESVEQYGISQITRHIYLWNSTYIYQKIETKDKLREDMPNAETRLALDEKTIKQFNIQLPSPRGGHAMTIAGNPQEYIIIFGGVTLERFFQDNTDNALRRTLDDLWVFHIRTSTWHQVFVNSKGKPGPREQSTFAVVKPDRLLLLYGGQYADKLYDDVWQYNINTNMWELLQVKYQGISYFKNCTKCSNCTYCDKKVYFPRLDCSVCHNCTSLIDGDYNTYTNMKCDYCTFCVQGRYVDCKQCKDCNDCYNATESPNPTGFKGHTMLTTSEGVFIYGGAHWTTTNLTRIDASFDYKDKFLEKCRNVLIQRTIIEQASAAVTGETFLELTIDDMGTDRWETQFKKTNNDCFNTKIFPPFPKPERSVYYGADMYFYSTKDCFQNCNDNGQCALGRCTCKNGFHGEGCAEINCPNSLCFVDVDTIDPQQCYHCSSNGDCINGKCVCKDDYFGPDCSMRGCPNNCSNTPSSKQLVGECIQDFPIGYCKCYEWLKRGGDDCSYIFCLNDCTGNGECKNGQCECFANYFGEDCSVQVIGISYSVLLKINVLIFGIYFILL